MNSWNILEKNISLFDIIIDAVTKACTHISFCWKYYPSAQWSLRLSGRTSTAALWSGYSGWRPIGGNPVKWMAPGLPDIAKEESLSAPTTRRALVYLFIFIPTSTSVYTGWPNKTERHASHNGCNNWYQWMRYLFQRKNDTKIRDFWIGRLFSGTLCETLSRSKISPFS